jgi:hypothetical protein
MICCVHACTGTKTANLSEPSACMNRSITSTLPRTWQDINRLLGPHRRLQLATVYKKVYFGVKIIAPPLRSQPLSFHWMKVMTKWHCSMYFNLWNISKGECFSSCTRHKAYACPKINNDMLWNKVTGSLASLSGIRLASKILCQLGCHLLWLCGSVVNLLLCTACERRWQALSIICLAAW